MIFRDKKCRIYAACGVLQTPNKYNRERGDHVLTMEILKFEWDENKNTINKTKHNVSFEEAQTVFL